MLHYNTHGEEYSKNKENLIYVDLITIFSEIRFLMNKFYYLKIIDK